MLCYLNKNVSLSIYISFTGGIWIYCLATRSQNIHHCKEREVCLIGCSCSPRGVVWKGNKNSNLFEFEMCLIDWELKCDSCLNESEIIVILAVSTTRSWTECLGRRRFADRYKQLHDLPQCCNAPVPVLESCYFMLESLQRFLCPSPCLCGSDSLMNVPAWEDVFSPHYCLLSVVMVHYHFCVISRPNPLQFKQPVLSSFRSCSGLFDRSADPTLLTCRDVTVPFLLNIGPTLFPPACVSVCIWK
jgi:hypothetical protein